MQHRHGLIALLVLAALTLGYFGGRASSPAVDRGAATQQKGDAAISTKGKSSIHTTPMRNPAQRNASTRPPLPPPGTPLRQTMAELKARADAGDAEAASRLYHDLQRCAYARRLKISVPNMARAVLAQSTKGVTEQGNENEKALLDMVDKQLNAMGNSAALCADLSPTEIDNVLPQALQAASLGDAIAAGCYVLANANGIAAGTLDHPEWLIDYKQYALPLAQQAIEQGNWSVVRAMMSAYDGSSRGLLSQITGADSTQAYQYFKLWHLGLANDPSARALDSYLDELGTNIDAQARTQADAWAQETFNKYFGAQPNAMESMSSGPCSGI